MSYTRPDLRERLKRKIMAGSKGGNPGQWSARKAQLLAAEYERAGGGYTGARSKAQRSLSRWTKQDWRTKSGKPSLETGERYLPAKAIEKLSASEYAATTRAKRRATGQFSRQPKRIAMKTKRYRNPATPQINTPEFKRWFGDSKVVDANGRPLVVYHGTNKSFTTFKTNRPMWFAVNPELASQFSAGGRRSFGSKPVKGSLVMPVFLRITNPLDLTFAHRWVRLSRVDLMKEIGVDTSEESLRELAKHQLASGYVGVGSHIEDPVSHLVNLYREKDSIYHLLDDPDMVLAMKSKGYDGLMMTESITTGTRSKPTLIKSVTYAVFDATQVKSAYGNRGTFDPNDPDIRNPATPEDMPPAVRKERPSPQIDTPAFKRWFAGSVVTTRDGEPRMMFHGTGWTNIREFKSFRAKGEIAGFFAFDPGFAQDFAMLYQEYGTTDFEEDEFGSRKLPAIYPVYLSLKKVFDIRKKEDRDAVEFDSLADRNGWVEGKLGWSWTVMEDSVLIRRMKEQGFDGYIDFEKGSNVEPTGIAVFDARRVKAAYGNRGTFDPNDPDIRNPMLYPPDQVRAYEKEAQSRLGFPDQTQLGMDLKMQKDRHWDTDDFKKWFKDSVVTDSKGNPMLVYHGTCKAGFTKFDPTKTREMGFHFGNWNQAKDFVGSRCEKSDIPGIGPGVYPVYLSIQRPLETPDLFSNIPLQFIEWIEKTNYKYKWFSSENDPYYKKLRYLRDRGSMATYKLSGFKLYDFLKIINKKIWNHLKAIIMRKGYDGIRYINQSEGNAGFADNIAWIAFSPAQVKSATENRGTYNRRDPYLDNPSMIRSKLSRIIEPGDRILCYDRAQGEDLYRLWDMVHTAGPLTKEALVEIEGLLDDDGVLVIESGEEPPGLRDHFRKVHKYGGMLLVQGPMNPEEARIETEKLRRELE